MKTLKNSMMILIFLKRLLPRSAFGSGILRNPVMALSGFHGYQDSLMMLIYSSQTYTKEVNCCNALVTGIQGIKNWEFTQTILLLGLFVKAAKQLFESSNRSKPIEGNYVVFLGCSGKWGVNSSSSGDYNF